MAILSWIVVGAFISSVALFFCKNTEKGSHVLLFLIGLVGAVIGGFTGRYTNFITQDTEFWNLEDWGCASIGTCIFLLMWMRSFIKKEPKEIPDTPPTDR